MQIDPDLSEALSDTFLNPRVSSLFRNPGREDRGVRFKTVWHQISETVTKHKGPSRNGRPGEKSSQRETCDVFTRTLRHRQAPASSGNLFIPESIHVRRRIVA